MEHKQLTWPQRGRLWLRLGIRLGLAALAAWLAVRFGRSLLSLFAPFLFALAAAALLNPLVKKLQRALGWNRQVLSAVLLILVFGLIGGGAALLVYAAAGQLVSLVQNWSGLLDSLQAVMDQLEALFAHLRTLAPPRLPRSLRAPGTGCFSGCLTPPPPFWPTGAWRPASGLWPCPPFWWP